MARRQGSHLRVDGPIGANVTEAEEVVDGARIDVEPVHRQRHQRLQLGTKGEAAILFGVIERLDPDRIARKRQATLLAIPDGDGEHAVQTGPRIVAPFAIGRQDRLGVAVRVKAVATPRQILAQRRVVVDFTVEDDGKTTVGRFDRLMSARDVDDAEPPHPESEIAIDQHAFIVGTAMADRVALRRDRIARHAMGAARVPACYATHANQLALMRRRAGEIIG